MNHAFYFGGMDLFLVSGAVTLAFQTAQVLVAGGAVVLSDETVWPGNGWYVFYFFLFFAPFFKKKFLGGFRPKS